MFEPMIVTTSCRATRVPEGMSGGRDRLDGLDRDVLAYEPQACDALPAAQLCR